VEPINGFVYEKVRIEGEGDGQVLIASIRRRKNGKGLCPKCKKALPGYDTMEERYWEHIRVWGMMVLLVYAAQRVNCPEHGILREWLPWALGKGWLTRSYMCFLARWAKRLPIDDVAQVFGTSWGKVFRAVQWSVEWGLENRIIKGIRGIGVDEIQWLKGQRYLTVVYQIEAGCRRLLWVGKDRTEETLRSFFQEFGEEWTTGVKFICSDMWQPYLNVIADLAKGAKNVLDRYHIVAKMNKAIDEVRAQEAKELKAQNKEPVLKGTRWIFLKRGKNRKRKERATLKSLLKLNLKTVRACLLKQEFDLRFWRHKRRKTARRFLESWCTKAMRSRLEPMKKIARSLRAHKPLILNWFKAREEMISLGAVEGFNNKAKVVKRRSYGFRSYEVMRVMLYHGLGNLPEPPMPRRYQC
jgi:transposase